MKKLILMAALTCSLLTFVNCKSNKAIQSASIENTKQMTVKGKITAIENGKDGYTAILEDKHKKQYAITISMINLQKNGGSFKRYEVGETITATGSSWNDTAGLTHVTATVVSQ